MQILGRFSSLPVPLVMAGDIKAVCLNRVTIICEYEQSIYILAQKSASHRIALKEYVPQQRNPAFTRFNVSARPVFLPILWCWVFSIGFDL